MKLNFSVDDSKAVGWLSFGRCGLGSFTFPSYNFDDNYLAVFPVKLCVCAMCGLLWL